MSAEGGNFRQLAGRIWINILMPDECAEAVRPWLEKWEDILPGWLERMNVFWDEEDSGAAMIQAKYEYRTAALYLRPNFLMHRERREYLIVHEFCHVLNEPLRNLLDDLGDQVAKQNEAMKDYLAEQRRHVIEQATVDMSVAFMRLRGEPGNYFV